MASYRRGHKRRIPFWTYAGWSSIEPANVSEAVSRETEPEPTPAATPAQTEQPTSEPTPSE